MKEDMSQVMKDADEACERFKNSVDDMVEHRRRITERRVQKMLAAKNGGTRYTPSEDIFEIKYLAGEDLAKSVANILNAICGYSVICGGMTPELRNVRSMLQESLAAYQSAFKEQTGNPVEGKQ